MRSLLVLIALAGTASAGPAPDLALARGKLLVARGDDVAAVAAFDELTETFPASPRAAEAAWLALDVLNRDQDFEQMFTHVQRYLAQRPLLRHRELAHDLRKLYLQFARAARPFGRRHGGGHEPPALALPAVDYEQEALERLDEFAADPRGAYSDELLYAAGWQFCISQHGDAAARAWRVLRALFPRSELARRAEIGLADLATCDGAALAISSPPAS